jgi:hypothetical protein
MKYSPKQKTWYCSECLHAAFLTAEAQKESVKKYQHSKKFKNSQDKYRQSDKGQKARNDYFHSDKYKERRKEYNERLKESLAIARQAHLERTSVQKPVETLRTEEFKPLIQDIREYIDAMGHSPTHHEVVVWAKDTYAMQLPVSKASELIQQAAKRKD